MAAEIIHGKEIAEALKKNMAEEAITLKAMGIVPGLAVILVGDDPASVSYVTGKEKACAEVGIHSSDNRLPADTSPETLVSLIREFNQDERIHGILVQLPLPRHVDEKQVLLSIDPGKDVDGYHPVSLGKMLLGMDTFLPATPFGVMKILEAAKVPTDGAKVVVLGRSPSVGRPLANLLSSKKANATVTICHSGTKDLPRITAEADILVAAVGKPGFVTASMVKEGATVIDVGVTRIPDSSKKNGFRLAGDVLFEEVSKVAGKITPVPGGVGPMTIAMLLYNTLKAAKTKAGMEVLS